MRPGRMVARQRLAAIDEAVRVIEEAFGGTGDQIVKDTGMAPEIELAYEYPAGTLAKDVTLAPWEVFMLLHMLRDAYASDVLGPTERPSLPQQEPSA